MKSLSLGQPHAIVMVGIPGSGKTFFASKFADTFNAPYVSLDAIEEYAGSIDAATGLSALFLNEIVKTKQSIIIEIDSASRASRTQLAGGLRQAGYQPLFVWVQTDTDTSQQRFVKQGGSRDLFEARLKRFSPPHENEKAIVISGKHTYATQARIVLKKLSVTRTDTPPVATPAARTLSDIRRKR